LDYKPKEKLLSIAERMIIKMERQHTVEVTITVDDKDLFHGQTVDELVFG